MQSEQNDIQLSVGLQSSHVPAEKMHAADLVFNSNNQEQLLLSLSSEIAAQKTRHELFRIVSEKIKSMLGVEQFCFSKLDDDGKSFSAFIMDFDSEMANDPDYERIRSTKYSTADPLFVEPMNSEDAILYNVDELAQRANMPDYVSYWKKTGRKYVMIAPLRVAGTGIGTAVFITSQNFTIDTNSVLLKVICCHLAVAVSNILANENVQKREQEKELLLSLSNEIAALKSRNDLFKVVNGKVRQLFRIRDFGFSKIDPGGKTFSAFIMDVDEKLRNHPDYEKTIATKFRVDDPLFTEVINSEDPVIYDVAELSTREDMPPYVDFWRNSGIQRVLISGMRVGGTPIGTAIFILEPDFEVDVKSILLKGVCSQLAVAISNILANEEILRRTDEKNILLSLSNEIAAIKSREDLFRIMNEKIKKFVGVRQLGFSKIDDGGRTYSVFLLDVNERMRESRNFDSIVQSHFHIDDPVMSAALDSEDPVMLDVSTLKEQPGMPPYVPLWSENGIERVVVAALRVGGQPVGAVVFVVESNFEFDVNSTLLRGICSQLAVTISNIIATEKIGEREAEKSKLLEFSNALASVRGKAVLGKVLKRQLLEFFGIEDYVVHALSADKKTHRPILFDPDSNFVSQPDFAKLLERDTDVNDGVFNNILSADDLVAFNIEDWFRSGHPPTYSKAAKAVGLKNMMGIAIRLGSENIGVMNFRRDGINDVAIQRPLFKSICSQIAITLSNLVANEKIERQLTEIERYRQQLEEEKVYLKEELETNHNYSEIIGESTAIKKVFRMITQVAPSDSTVLILGETGTGKELIARAIHNASPRKDKLMVKINCAALPANLIESELFGHERGSFTGAVERRIGKFELANKGTLFLDEVGEMPLELQVKLLRAIQEKEIERVGGKVTIRTDVRIIAATNRDLEKLMEEGKFRPDLYYRLNIFPINVPALRERKEDIPALAMYFINRFSKKAGKKIGTMSSRVLEELRTYDWPGNIREMEHLIERSMLLSNSDTLKEIHLPDSKKRNLIAPESSFKLQTIFENEKEYILKVLKHVNGRISGEGGAAEILGIPASTLNSRMKKLGIRRAHLG